MAFADEISEGLTVGGRSTVTVLIDIDVDNDLSSAADMHGDTLCGLVLPSNYTTAAITFQVSVDGTTFAPLYDKDGAITISATQAQASRGIKLIPEDFWGFRYIKIATGSAQTTDDKTIILVGRTL